MTRSAKGFCQGARGAMTTSWIPMPLEEFSALVVKDHEPEEQAEGQGRDYEEADSGDLVAVRSRKDRHVGEGRGDGRRMYLAIVSSATS